MFAREAPSDGCYVSLVTCVACMFFRTAPSDKNVAIIFSQPMAMELMSYQHVLWTPYTSHPVLGLDDIGSPHAGHGMPVCYEKVSTTGPPLDTWVFRRVQMQRKNLWTLLPLLLLA